MSLAEEARRVRERIAERLRELEPMVREYEELKRLATDMGIDPDHDPDEGADEPREPAPRSAPRRRRAASDRAQGDRPPEAPRSRTGRGQAGQAGAGGELGARVLEAVRSEPGKTVGEYATILGVSQTTLYRPVRELTNERAIVKRARQLFPG